MKLSNMAAPRSLCNPHSDGCYQLFFFRRYFINLNEKTTTWEDPRNKYKQVYGSAIPMQDLSRVS